MIYAVVDKSVNKETKKTQSLNNKSTNSLYLHGYSLDARLNGRRSQCVSLPGWLGDLDPLTHHEGCDIIKGTKWIANAWLALAGNLGTGDAFKGWIDHGKDESVFEPGTNWKGEAINKGARQNNQEACKDDEKGNEGAMKDQVSETGGKEKEMKQEPWKDEEKFSKEEERSYLTREVKKQKDGSYDVKLEL